jgi:ribosomal protein S12 methylthiotransferase accessory factor
LSLAGFERHNALLAGYEKLQKAKATNWSEWDLTKKSVVT